MKVIKPSPIEDRRAARRIEEAHAQRPVTDEHRSDAISVVDRSTTGENCHGETTQKTDLNATWRTLIADLRARKKELLASALSHGRVLCLSSGQLRLGFSAQEGMFRRQIERAQKDAETAISQALGEPTALVLETVAASAATPSLAQEESDRARVREEKMHRTSREHPAVQATLRIFDGVIEQIRALDEEQEEYAAAPEDGEDEP